MVDAAETIRISSLMSEEGIRIVWEGGDKRKAVK
jgi:hypothetical protein